MKVLIIIIVLAVTIFTSSAQKYHPSVQMNMVKMMNSARAMYGIWRLDELSIVQPQADSVALLFHKRFSMQENVSDDDLHEFINSPEFNKALGKANYGIWSGLLYARTLDLFYEQCTEKFSGSGSDILNPLAYHVCTSVVSDSAGRYFGVILTYR